MDINMNKNTYKEGPDSSGNFGDYGGRYVAETLMPLILDLEKAYDAAKIDPKFIEERNNFAKDYIGRESPLYFAERLTEYVGGAKIYFKRDELNHTGSHKINNCLGQILLARRMGKTGSLLKLVLGNMELLLQLFALGLDCLVLFIWEPLT